jgi:hypothetical protein
VPGPGCCSAADACASGDWGGVGLGVGAGGLLSAAPSQGGARMSATHAEHEGPTGEVCTWLWPKEVLQLLRQQFGCSLVGYCLLKLSRERGE